MRLTEFKFQTLKHAAQDSLGEQVQWRLSGSRTDHSCRGVEVGLSLAYRGQMDR